MSEKRESVIKLGSNRDKPRVWIEGQWLTNFGFAPGTKLQAEFKKGEVRLKASASGLRKVSTRGRGRDGGIIDINTADLLNSFTEGSSLRVVAQQGEIVITPSKTLAKKAARILTTVAVALFAGGGLLDQGAKAAGFETAAAVEVNPAYAEVWERNHAGNMHESPIEEVDFAQMATDIGPVGLLTAGRPCEPYSKCRTIDRGGQTKRDKTLPPEAHELGHLDYYVLSAVEHLNPHTVIIENVPGYLDAGSGFSTQGVLRAMGYNVEARVLNSLDYGALTARQRAVIVATSHDRVVWPETVTQKLTAASILDDIPADSDLWFGEDYWAPQYWAKQTAKGNGFAPKAITPADTSLPTLKKRQFSLQGDSLVVAHPTLPNKWRWLTLDEGRRMMGLPDSFDLGPTKTIAGEVLGQGVHVGLFQKIVASVMQLPRTKARRAA